jgi:hypothetical protein
VTARFERGLHCRRPTAALHHPLNRFHFASPLFIEFFCRRRPDGSTCSGANLVPQSGQTSKIADGPLTSRVMLSRSTVTPVHALWLAPRPDFPKRKKLARSLSHWYIGFAGNSVVLAADVAAVAEKRPVTPSNKF